MKKIISNELKIGVFVLLALGAGGFFMMQTQNITTDTYNVKTYFHYAGAIKANAVVMLSGIEVGRIEEINFVYDDTKGTMIETILSISKQAKVRADSLAYIGTTGFVGDAFVGLTTGSAGAPFVKDGATIASEDPIEMRELMKKADAIGTKLEETLVDVKALAANLNSTVEDNRGKIDSIILNIEQTAVNFNEFSTDIKKHPWKLLMKGKE